MLRTPSAPMSSAFNLAMPRSLTLLRPLGSGTLESGAQVDQASPVCLFAGEAIDRLLRAASLRFTVIGIVNLNRPFCRCAVAALQS